MMLVIFHTPAGSDFGAAGDIYVKDMVGIAQLGQMVYDRALAAFGCCAAEGWDPMLLHLLVLRVRARSFTASQTWWKFCLFDVKVARAETVFNQCTRTTTSS